MKSYKTKSKTRSRSRNKSKIINKTKKWDVLVHAINNASVLQYISNDKMLKCPEKQINAWLLDKKTKDNFGDYFNYGNNRYNIIKLLTKNIDKINLLKYEKSNSKNSNYTNEQKNQDIEIYTPAVYTTYIYSDLNFKGEDPFYGSNPPPIIFIISSKILKDKSFIICESMMFGNCINIANNFYTFKKGFYSKGNLKRKPSMRELQDFLNKKIPEDRYYNSHEIMFDNIPLKYVNSILYNDKVIIYEQLRKMFPQKHIHIVKLPTKKAIDKDTWDIYKQSFDESKIIDVSDYKNYKKFIEPYSY